MKLVVEINTVDMKMASSLLATITQMMKMLPEQSRTYLELGD